MKYPLCRELYRELYRQGLRQEVLEEKAEVGMTESWRAELVPLLQGTQFERNRAAAAKALGQIMKDAEPSEEVDKVAEHVDRLVSLLNADGEYIPTIVEALGYIGPVHENVVPNIVNKCELLPPAHGFQTTAMRALTRMGPKAAGAVPYVKRFLSAPINHWESAKALVMIEAMKFIQAVGPTGNEALPAVEKLTTYKREYFPEDVAKALRAEAAKTAGMLKGVAPGNAEKPAPGGKP